MMKQPRRVGLPAKWLPVIIRLTALGYLLFFLPDLVLAATHRIHTLPPWLGRLFSWGEGGDAIAVMFATVCTVRQADGQCDAESRQRSANSRLAP